MRPLDVAVAGCGIAGMAAAVLLARDGHRVTLFERFDAARAVGSGLMIQPTGQAVLRALGADAAIAARGARIDRLIGLACPSGRTVLDVRYAALARADAHGIGIHRTALFDALHELVRGTRIAIETGRTAIAADLATGGRRRLRFVDGAAAGPFDLIVDASGARSPLAGEPTRTLPYGALWATLPWPASGNFDAAALQQRYRAASVMAGVMPAGRDRAGRALATLFWSLRADRLAAWHAAGLDAWKADLVALWPATAALLDTIAHRDQLTFARYAHRTLARAGAAGLIHIGDAWHSTSPQLGQGANMALLDAYALAQAMRRHADPGEAIAHAIDLRRGHVRLYQAMSAIFTPAYQSDGRALPWLRDWLVGPMSRLWPVTRLQAATVSGLIGDPLTRLGLR